MYEAYPDPPAGVTVWHKRREEFGRVVGPSTDPDSIIMDFDGEHVEVSRNQIEKSIFWDHNHPKAGV
jgi:hypothetical protein